MCGIAGFVDSPRSHSSGPMEQIVRSMADSMPHRGPDDGGVWLDPAAGVALGHRRLSILDLSPEGRQPMRSRCGRYTLAFNGEIYNHRQIRKDLDCSFRGTSDTETMLAAFTEWGLWASLKRFNGMFAFALWDKVEAKLFLARDRIGEKPLYYGRFGSAVIFGSELKALRAHPAFRGEIDRGALALYLRLSYIPAPFSIYRNVFKLQPATVLTLDPGERTLPEPVEYWSARDAAERGVAHPHKGPQSEVVSEIEELIGESVRMRMEADVPLGAFLSGGIDSSTIVALMQANSTRPVRTFTIGFHESHYNEAEQAKRVARHLGTEHTELYITPAEAMAVIPRLPAIYDEPFADSSQIPTFLVSELARRHVTVSLSGDGGDELFGGYVRYLWGQTIWRNTRWMPPVLKTLAAGAITSLPADSWQRIFRVLSLFLPPRFGQRNTGDKLHKLAEVMRAPDPDAMYLGLVSQWKDPARVVLSAHEPPTALTDRRQWANLAEFTQRMMFIDTVTYLPDDILVKLDRAAMAVSLEGRVPLLDHRLIEFAWRLPSAMKIRNGKGKWMLRQILNRHVPRSLTDRPKMGFAVPIDAWLRGPLRGWAEELLNERNLRDQGLFDPKPILEKWREHLSGSRNWQSHLWNVLMFQAWLEKTGQETPSVVLPAPACTTGN